MYQASIKSIIVKYKTSVPRSYSSIFGQEEKEKQISVVCSNIVTSYKKEASGKIVGVYTPIELIEAYIDTTTKQLLHLNSVHTYYPFNDIRSIKFWLEDTEGNERKNVEIDVHFSYRKVPTC